MKYTDEFINENNRRILSTLEIIPRHKHGFHCQTKGKTYPWKIPDAVNNEELADNESNKTDQISDNLKKYLMAVNIHQFTKTLTEILDCSGFALGTGSRLNKQSEQKGLVRIIKPKVGRGSPKYPILTDAGYSALGLTLTKFHGRGGTGPEHYLYQVLIKERFSVLNPKIELNRKNKFIDVGIETQNSLIAIECELSTANINENIDRDFNLAEADFLYIACLDKKIMTRAKEIVDGFPDEIQIKTQILLISDLLKKEPDELIPKNY